MKISIHHYLALCWAIGAPWTFAPVLQQSTKPGSGAILAWGVVIVAVMIFVVPILLRWPLFRRWYGWADAMSERQRLAIEDRALRRYCQVAFDDGYISRLKPYVWRILATTSALVVMMNFAGHTGSPILDALALFSPWYPLGVLLLITTSWPHRWLLSAHRDGSK